MIEEDTECVGGEFVVDDHITITAGARLVLEDCTLVFDAPDYTDEWMSGSVQGLLLHVAEGGALEIRAVDGEAGMRPLDRAYAYSLQVDGDLVLQGTPDHPVRVTGLEGYMTEVDLRGGIKVAGTATVSNTNFTVNQGPALHVVEGGEATATGVTVRKNTGAFGVVQGSLALTDVHANVGVIVLIAHDSDVSLDNASFVTNMVAVQAWRTDLVVDGSDLAGGRVSVDLLDADAHIRDTRIRYGDHGIVHQHGKGEENSLRIENSTVEAVLGRNSTGVWSDKADLHIVDSRILGYTNVGINLRGGDVEIVDTRLEGAGLYDILMNRPDSMTFQGVTVEGGSGNGIVYSGILRLQVVDGHGPVQNATVSYEGETYTTRDDGNTSLLVAVPVDAAGVPHDDRLRLTIDAGERQRDVEVDLFATEHVVDLDARSSNSVPGPSVAAVLVVLSVGLVLARRRA